MRTQWLNEVWQLGMSVLMPGHTNWNYLIDGIARPPLSTTVVGSHNPEKKKPYVRECGKSQSSTFIG